MATTTMSASNLTQARRAVAAVATDAVSRSAQILSRAAARRIGENVALDLIVSGHVAGGGNAGLAVDVDGVQLALDPDGSLRIDGQPAIAMPESEWEADQRELDKLRAAASVRAPTTAPAAPPPGQVAAPSPLVVLGSFDDAALRALAAEVERRRVQDGDMPEHDDVHVEGELAQAAATFAFPPRRRAMNGAGVPYSWPFHFSTWRTSGDRERELLEAGALIVAELARLQRSRLPPLAKP